MITGQSPRVVWKKNSGGKSRTIEEAIEIAARYVSIPSDVAFFVDEIGELGPDLTTRGPRVTKPAGGLVVWSDLFNKQTGKVPFIIRPDILQSDEAIIAVMAHELFELECLRRIFDEETSMFIEHFRGHTQPNNPGNLHDEAWDYADRLIDLIREERT